MRANRMFLAAQIIVLILVVGTFAIGVYYWKPPDGPDETGGPARAIWTFGLR